MLIYQPHVFVAHHLSGRMRLKYLESWHRIVVMRCAVPHLDHSMFVKRDQLLGRLLRTTCHYSTVPSGRTSLWDLVPMEIYFYCKKISI